MGQIILVCGEYVMEKELWRFVVDKRIERGCKTLPADENTKFNDFVSMVYDEYGLDETKYGVELSYLLFKKMLKGVGEDTPPVVVDSTRQLQGFIALSKSDPIRLSVVVKDKVKYLHNDNSQEYLKEIPEVQKDVEVDEHVSLKVHKKESRYAENDSYVTVSNVHETEEDDVFDDGSTDVEGDGEFDSRFDCCDDSDGASSDDEDFTVHGSPPTAESVTLPIKKRTSKPLKMQCEGFTVMEKLQLDALNVRVGQRFRSKDELETRLKMLSVVQKFDFDVDRSEPTLYVVKCWLDGCSWRLRASTIEGEGSDLHIRIFVDEHTCSITERSSRGRQATPDILGRMYKDYIGVLGPKVLPSELADALKVKFGVKMDYWKAHRTLKVVRELTTGTPEKGYEDLPAFMHFIRQANPGSLTRLVVDDDKTFKYLFIAFSASITGFPYLRKVVVVDGTFLQGKYKGTLLIATTQDGNFQIFPIAFGIVDTENDESWEWFFRQLSIVLPDDEDLAIISDRHQSIGKAIGKVYQKASRGICTYHLYKNILVRFKGKSAFKLVKKAARCYKMSEFETIFDEIKATNSELHSYLQRADVHLWARVHFSGDRYNIMTTNIAESLNKVLSVSRSLPIVRLLEEIRLLMTRWFCNRRNDARAMKTTLTRGVEKLLEARVSYARTLKVHMIDVHLFEVTSVTSSEVVNLTEKTCSCRRFDFEKIPCAHAIAAAETKSRSRIGLCHQFYSKEYLCCAYSGSIMPGDKSLPIPEHVVEQVCLPPLVRQPPGRPKKSRLKSSMEIAMENKRPRKGYTCSRCHQVGHNVKTCTANL